MGIDRLFKRIARRNDISEDKRINMLLMLMDDEDRSHSPEPNVIIQERLPEVKQQADSNSTNASDVPDDLISVQDACKMFGYSSPDSIRSWYLRYPDEVPPYRVRGRVFISQSDGERFMNGPHTRGKNGRSKDGVIRQDSTRQYPRPSVHVISSPWTSAEALFEFDTITGASARSGLSQNMVRELIESGKLDMLQVIDSKIVSVNQIEALKSGKVYSVSFSVFHEKKFMIMVEAFSELGIKDPHNYTSYCTLACRKGTIANRKIGRFRFVSVSDLERWFLEEYSA